MLKIYALIFFNLLISSGIHSKNSSHTAFSSISVAQFDLPLSCSLFPTIGEVISSKPIVILQNTTLVFSTPLGFIEQVVSKTLTPKLSLFFIAMTIAMIFFGIRSRLKSNKIKELEAIALQCSFEKMTLENKEFASNLQATTKELNDYAITIKKVTLLKKQLETIFTDKQLANNEKEALKQVKVCMNVFFDNYRELNQLLDKKLFVDKIVKSITQKYPDLNECEIKVIEYIGFQFTTKEIAILINKSEKSIEYYRTQIRKKVQLSTAITLDDFVQNFLN